MKIAACAALILACALPARAAPEAPPPARVIVKYKADSALMRPLAAADRARPLHAQAMGRRLGLAMNDRWVLGPRMQSLSARGIAADELARRLAAQPEVEWAVPVGRKTIASVPNDPYYRSGLTDVTPAAGQWYLRAPDSTFVSATNAIGAWALTTGSGAITVAVLDTGVRFDHPDFIKADGSSKLWPGYDFVSRTATAADGNGMDGDASDPGDYSTASDICGAGSSTWHGTQTAGIVGAATDNGIGIAGLGRNVMVLPVRVLGKCGGYDDDIVAAMLWAGGLSSDPVPNPNPAKVLNMSLGSAGACDRAYQDAVTRLTAAGVTVVVAAGNADGAAVNTPGNCVGAIAVAGVRHVGTKVGFSSVGPEVALAAPGGNCVVVPGSCLYPIMTTTNSGRQGPVASTYSSGSNASVGTSFASPQVAATAALMLSADPRLTPAAIKAALQATVRPFPAAPQGVPQCQPPGNTPQVECACTTTTCGAGMLDAEQAVRAVMPAVAAAPVAAVQASATTAAAGGSLTLWSTGSGAFGNRTIASYAWAVVSGTSVATISGANDGPSVRIAAAGPGSATVRLTITDSGGASASSSTTLTVVDPNAPATPPTTAAETGSGGGGGGGAVSAAWLALLAAAVAALSAGGKGRSSRRSRPA